MASKLQTWTLAHVTRSGDAVSEVIDYAAGRVFCRIITNGSQFLYVWLPVDAVTVTRHMTWVQV